MVGGCDAPRATSWRRRLPPDRRLASVRARASDPDRSAGPKEGSEAAASLDLPLFPRDLASFAQQVGVGATVAFGGLVFAISFATLVFTGPDAPEVGCVESCEARARTQTTRVVVVRK